MQSPRSLAIIPGPGLETVGGGGQLLPFAPPRGDANGEQQCDEWYSSPFNIWYTDMRLMIMNAATVRGIKRRCNTYVCQSVRSMPLAH